MPDILCRTPVNLCTDPAVPTANFSSETPDAEAFFGRGYSTGVPPLGSEWKSTGCLGTCTSTVSQAAADNCAANQNIICRSTQEPVLEPNPNPDQTNDPYIPVTRQTFGNDPQDCESNCPDGNIFAFQVPVDTILAMTQAEADASALSLACNQAALKRICLGELTPAGACVDALYDGQVEISGLNPPYTITVTAGALPPGLVMVQDPNTAFISGIPTVTGAHIFTLRAQDAAGNFNEKTFTLNIAEISQDTLPDAGFGQAYSQTLTAVGTTGAVTWAVTSGALPTGLSLNASTGEITGTPSVAGTFTFTVTMTDET